MAELGHFTRKRKKEEDEEPHNPREWYMFKISSEKDKEKEAEEKLAKKGCQITDAELRGPYLAFHHDDRHQGELDRVPMLSPVVKLKLGTSFRFYGTSSASIGSFVYRIGGYCGKQRYSRNLRYFDSSRPEEGLKTQVLILYVPDVMECPS